MEASNGSGGGLSYSWLHAATSGSGGPDGGGFYMNGDKSRFLPFEFNGDWDGSVLTVNLTSQVGSLANGIGSGIDGGNTLEFIGGALEQLAGDVVRGYIQYEIEDGAGVVNSGFFFVWGSSNFAGQANSLTSAGAAGSELLTLTAWANNWINGKTKDWSFLEALSNNALDVTFDGTNTTDATYNTTSNVLLTSDGTRPSGVPLGIDLCAAGNNTTIVFPLPLAAWAGTCMLSAIGNRAAAPEP